MTLASSQACTRWPVSQKQISLSVSEFFGKLLMLLGPSISSDPNCYTSAILPNLAQESEVEPSLLEDIMVKSIKGPDIVVEIFTFPAFYGVNAKASHQIFSTVDTLMCCALVYA